MAEKGKQGQKPLRVVLSQHDREMLESTNEKVEYLSDLFNRRLKDDRQKDELIETLTKQAEYAYIEPFLHDLILLLDRLEKSDDEFVQSVYDELSDILSRRGVDRIDTSGEFDPLVHKAVKSIDSSDSDSPGGMKVVRSGYVFNDKVVRPAEVILVTDNSERANGDG